MWRYFKGDIKIGSVHGHGTDVYVYLQRLSSLAQENLPIFNAVSSAKLTNTAIQVTCFLNLRKWKIIMVIPVCDSA